MKGNIFKRLLYCLFLSLIVAFLLGGLGSGNEGNEARQGTTLQVMFAIGFCVMQFVFSLTALLNYIEAVRKNFIASAVTFLFLPMVMVAGLIQMFVTAEGSRNDLTTFVATIGPPIFFVLTLIYQFVLFRRTINVSQ